MYAAIIDDNQSDVRMLSGWLENIEIEPRFIGSPGASIDEIFDQVSQLNPEVVIVDYQLHNNNYSLLSGIEIVSGLVKKRLPAFLLTSYQAADMPDYVSRGRHIPCLLKKSDIDDVNLPRAIELAKSHVNGLIRDEQRALPTIVRIEQVNFHEGRVYLRIPALNGDPGVSMTLARLASSLEAEIKEGLRFEADVNIGAIDHSMVFIDSPRLLPKLTEEYEKLLRN